MSTAASTPDAGASQVMFLNFRSQGNHVSLCHVPRDVMDPLLTMLNLTPNFVSSLKMPQKRAIVFLVIHAVDWRTCPQEYNDITLCFSRLSRREKSVISGLGEQGGSEPLDHAQYIWENRIKPNIDHLRERSYELNRSLPDIVPPSTASLRTAGPSPFPDVAIRPNGFLFRTVYHDLQPVRRVDPVLFVPPTAATNSAAADAVPSSSLFGTQASSSSVAVPATVTSTPTADTGPASHNQQGIVETEAEGSSTDAQPAHSGTDNVPGGLVASSQAENEDCDEKDEGIDQEDVHMEVDNDESSPVTASDEEEM